MTVGTGKMLEMARITELKVGVETVLKMEWRVLGGNFDSRIYYICQEHTINILSLCRMPFTYIDDK